MRRISLFLLVLSLLILGLPSRLPAQAQGVEYQFFNETKHNVQGEFLRFYKLAADPVLLYGYPITEEMTSKDGQRRVQYFQRARFEYHAHLPEGQRVALTPLGAKVYKPGSQLNLSTNLGCRRFENGFSVCFSFLEFYDKYGGYKQFGNPISSFEYQDSLIVQYFENARFEWQPNKLEGQRVVITDLGRLYFAQLNEDSAALEPAPPLDGRISPEVQTLQVRAFCWKAVTLATDQQWVYITVQDQTLQPVKGAKVDAWVHWPAGVQKITNFTTDDKGVVMIPLTFTNQPYGQLINIEVRVAYNRLSGYTSTSFRIWY